MEIYPHFLAKRSTYKHSYSSLSHYNDLILDPYDQNETFEGLEKFDKKI